MVQVRELKMELERRESALSEAEQSKKSLQTEVSSLKRMLQQSSSSSASSSSDSRNNGESPQDNPEDDCDDEEEEEEDRRSTSSQQKQVTLALVNTDQCRETSAIVWLILFRI